MIELSHQLAELACKVLRQRRLDLSLSQETLSKRTGLARSYVSDVERGSRHPTFENLTILTECLEWTVSEFARETEIRATQLLDPNKLVLARESKAELTSLENEICRYISNRISEGIVIASCDGKFALFNNRATTLTGVGLQEVPPDEWSEIYGCFRTDRVTPIPTQELPLMQALKGSWSNKVSMFLRNQECPGGRYLEVEGRQICNASGAITGAMIIFDEVRG